MPRTYIYYSDDKINHYRGQIDEPRLKRVLERFRGLDLTIMGNGFGVDIGPAADPGPLQDLQKVWLDLDEQKQIGTFDDPADFVYGKLDFHYGLFNQVNPPVLFLVGQTDTTVVALGGSQRFVRGHRDVAIPVADDAENVFLEQDVAQVLAEAAFAQTDDPSEPNVPDARMRHQDLGRNVANTYWYMQKDGRPRARFEVLAHLESRSTLQLHGAGEMAVLVGSPLFVALA